MVYSAANTNNKIKALVMIKETCLIEHMLEAHIYKVEIEMFV